MKKLALGISSLLVVVAFAMPLGAQEITCADVSFDEQIMATYPAAPDACQEILEVDGVRYAHFRALVHREGFPSMLLRFRHGDAWGPATLVMIPAGYKVYQGDQPVDAKDVPRGRELSFYMPEGRWQVAETEAAIVTEATFEPLVFEVTDIELTEEVDMEAPALAVADAVEEAGYEADEAAEAAEAVEQAADDAEGYADDSEWLWILGLAGAFVIVWFLLRRRKARREG